MLSCMAWREGDQWVAVCLDFNLAAQDDCFEDVRDRLNAQIHSYLMDALAGKDQTHARYLLRRRAPLRYWLAYYFLAARHALRIRTPCAREYSSPIPLVPA